jgi:GMP synthase (glutamine-hydrolysing)
MLLIIDFGSQYNQLIARRVREHHVYCQIEPPTITLEAIRDLHPEGIILSGGPSSIYEPNAPQADPGIFTLGVPVLGICYGLQSMVHTLGGEVVGAEKREYGFAELSIERAEGIFNGIEKTTRCWMSHGDSIGRLPKGFRVTARTASTPSRRSKTPNGDCTASSSTPKSSIRRKASGCWRTFSLQSATPEKAGR